MIELHHFSRADFARLIGWADSPAFLMQWAGPIFTHPLDEAQLESYVQTAEGEKSSRRIFKAVETCGDVVGHIELNNIDRRNRSAMVSRVLVDPTQRGKGYGVELVQRVADVGFGELGLHRLELFVFDFNEAAIACYRRCGFVIEGRLRDARRVGDEYWSLHVMSLLASDWKRRGPQSTQRDRQKRRTEAPVASPPDDPSSRVAPAIAQVALVVRDYDEAINYFVGTLGFTLIEDKYVPDQEKRWVVVAPAGSSGARLLLARAVGKEQSSRIGNQTGGRVFLFLQTDDFWRDFHVFKAKGVVFVREPSEENYGTAAVFQDLYGNLWDLVQPNERRRTSSML